MLCDICNKNQATVHLTEIVDDQMTELHLCEECAKQKSIQMEQKFGLSDLLAGLVDFGKNIEGQKPSEIRCLNCDLSYEDFKKTGRLGCSNCYSYFMKYLTPLLKRIHGTAIHTGKFPQGVAGVEIIKKPESIRPKSELLELKSKLQEVIKFENFEEAAKLRDKIKELEKKKLDSDKSETSVKEMGKTSIKRKESH
ncbi:UvrB/UvrC motif-containing protein [bacterium]|nr:UvrB/UvrC motif-containing protein [bacterium]